MDPGKDVPSFPLPIVILLNIMTKSWDAIVIGAGVGGLTAAATLVKAGKRVLVLDKSPHPGGTAYVYQRKGFTFPMGPLGFSSPERVRKALSELGAGQDLQFRRVHYRIKAFGVQVPLSLSFENMGKNLSQVFPQDAVGIGAFFQDTVRIISAMASPEEKDSRTLLAETGNTSASQYLASRISDWRLRRFLGSIGTHEPYSSMALLAAMWNLMSNEGIWYPVGGMRSFSHRLVRAVAQGSDEQDPLGEIRIGAEVRQIRLHHGKVRGVLLADGTGIDAEDVISNADFKTTFLTLMDPRELPDTWRRQLVQAKQTGSVFQVCLGIDTDKADLSAFSKASRLLYRRKEGFSDEGSTPMDWLAGQIDPESLADQELEMSLLSKDDPSLAPKGGSVVVIRTEADHGHFSQYRSQAKRRTPSYKPYKMHLAQALIREAGRIVSGLEGAVQVVDVATPLTFEDQGGRSQGAVAGWSWDYEDTTDYEPLDLTLTPIQGLYMAGYQAYSNLFMGGVPTAITSGQKAAQCLLKGAGPIEALNIPGASV
jgi:phytoene dehydrogenase-like protein